jgi:23S rRNA pseudouridine1911/1915/1917 synthase
MEHAVKSIKPRPRASSSEPVAEPLPQSVAARVPRKTRARPAPQPPEVIEPVDETGLPPEHAADLRPDEEADLPADADLPVDELALLPFGGLTVDLAPFTLKLTPEACGMRLDRAVSTLVTRFSRSRLQQWIESGHITVDGKPGRTKMTVFGDETIAINPQAAPDEQAFTPEAMALDIVHEDATLLVLNKPAGLVVHPAAGNWTGTLLNGLLHKLPFLAGVPRAGIVHRLDKETTGLMVVAKTIEAQTDLVRQLQARSVRREYLALAWGKVPRDGAVDAAIGRHPKDRLRMAVSQGPTAKAAVTHYHVVGAGMLDGKPVTLLQCRLETGRTHQIRVHMQSIGFPLVGDPLYGKPHLARYFRRQALHAFRLGLLHPKSGKPVSWEIGLPDDLTALLAAAGVPALSLEPWELPARVAVGKGGMSA